MKPCSLVFRKWLGKWLDYYYKYHSTWFIPYTELWFKIALSFIPHYLSYIGINLLVNRYFTENTLKALWLSLIISNKIDLHSLNTVRSMMTVAYLSSSYISLLWEGAVSLPHEVFVLISLLDSRLWKPIVSIVLQ